MQAGFIISMRFLLCLMPVLLGATAAHSATDHSNLEYKVKAAYLYNFTKFVSWPESNPGDPLNICILGEDPFGYAVDLLENKTARGRPVVVIYMQDIDNHDCQVIFISRSEADRLASILQLLANQPVLTVSDIDGFAMKGGCIRLQVVNGKVRFNVNILAARQARLEMSAKLLELARMVIE